MTQYYFTVTDSHGDSFDDANGEECASAAEAISLAETIAWELAADDGHHDGFTVVVSDNKGVEFMRVPVPRIQGPIRGAAGGRGN